MDVKELKAEGLNRSYSVKVGKKDLEEKLVAKIKEMQPQVSLKGFRPGKVPAAHIRKMFGQSIMNDIVQDVVNDTVAKTIEDKNLRPAGQPKIDLRANGEEVTKGNADLEYTLSMETIPEFDPADPAKMKFTRLVTKVDDAEIDRRIKEIADSQKSYKKKAKTAKAKKEDAVLINFTGRIDGEAFEGGAMEDHQLVLGSGTFIPGFEDQLIGTKAGEKLDVTVDFPEDYQATELAGKTAVFETEVLEVQGETETEVDDEFAKKFGLDDLAALKDAISKQAEAENEQQSRMKLKRAILDELDSKHDFELPPGMVEAEFGAIWNQVKAEMEKGELDEEDAKKSEDQLEADYRKIAERRVRLGLVLAEIGNNAEVQISNEELQNAIMNEARRFPGQEQQVFEMYNKNPQLVQQLRAPIFEEKVVDLIIEKAEMADKDVKRDILFEDDPMI